ILYAGAVLVLPLFGLASVTLVASVWTRQTREAVLWVYVVVGLGGLLVWAVGGPLDYFNPLFLLEPAWGPAAARDVQEAGRRLLIAAGAWGGIIFGCLALAMWRLRPVYVREIEHVTKTKTAWYSVERPPVDDEPIRWLERHIGGLSP